MKETLIVALGGNAISNGGEIGNIEKQRENIRGTAEKLFPLVKKFNLVLTHGNGPQVGVLLLRSDLAKKKLPVNPLPNAVAQTQSGIGYWIAQELENSLRKKHLKKEAVVVSTRVLVSERDPAFKNPSKPIGAFFSRKEALKHARAQNWKIIRDSNRGYRRVVSSPEPIEIIELDSIKTLMRRGKIVVACGGGGIPVIKRGERLSAADAVIDKDKASVLLAKGLGIKRVLFLTDVDAVCLNYGKPEQKEIRKANVKQLKGLLKEGHFSAGSMKPKIEAVISFLESGGKEAVITSPKLLLKALNGKKGTHLTR